MLKVMLLNVVKVSIYHWHSYDHMEPLQSLCYLTCMHKMDCASMHAVYCKFIDHSLISNQFFCISKKEDGAGLSAGDLFYCRDLW